MSNLLSFKDFCKQELGFNDKQADEWNEIYQILQSKGLIFTKSVFPTNVCSMLNCSGRENNVKYRETKVKLDRAKKLLKDCCECFTKCGVSGAEGVYEIEVAIDEFLKECEI